MGMSIEDMLTVSEDRYHMNLLAGKDGWSNSISWILLVEDIRMLRTFTGKEVVVTTGAGFQTEEKLDELVDGLLTRHASGLVVTTGSLYPDLPEALVRKCAAEDFPLMTVPESVHLSDMIKDMSFRILLQDANDEKIADALVRAIESPESEDVYKSELLRHYDIDGDFRILLITTGDLDVMDSVERRRLAYSFQIYLENLGHNTNFTYYDPYFMLMLNNVPESTLVEVVDGFLRRTTRRNPDQPVFVGIGSSVHGIRNLRRSYLRARSAVRMALTRKKKCVYFDEMGIQRLLYSIEDEGLKQEMGEDLLRPLIEYDAKHGTDYVETLDCYLASDGSIQGVADALFIHRNTATYRMNTIRQLLNCRLETSEERLPYRVACLLMHG